jgi:hypothetical protein
LLPGLSLLLMAAAGRALGQQASPQRAPASQRPAALASANQPGVPAPVAQPPRLVVRMGAGHSDNILRLPSGGESGSYNAPGLAFGFSRNAPRMITMLDGDLEHRNYNVAGVPGELYGTLNASVELYAVPDRFSWLVGDNYGQTRRDPFRIDSPLNREYINVASTGPRLRIPIGSRTELRLDGTAARRRFQYSSVLDSTARTVDIGLSRALSVRSQYGFTASRRHTEYSKLSGSDNHVDNIYASYQSRLATGSALLALGRSRFVSGANPKSTGYLDFDWQRDVGARSRLDFSASNGFVDTGQTLASTNLTGGDAERIAALLISSDVYRLARAGLVFSMQFPRTRVELDTSTSRATYESEHTLNNDLHRVGLQLRHTVSPRLEGAIAVYGLNRKFAESAQRDKDKLLRLSLTKHFGYRFSLQIAYQHDTRDSAIGNSFDENTVRLLFLCDLVPHQTRAVGGSL